MRYLSSEVFVKAVLMRRARTKRSGERGRLKRPMLDDCEYRSNQNADMNLTKCPLRRIHEYRKLFLRKAEFVVLKDDRFKSKWGEELDLTFDSEVV